MRALVVRPFVVLLIVFGMAGAGAAASDGMTRDDWLLVPAGLALTFVGGLLIVRVPLNRVSWLMASLGLTISALGVADFLLSDTAAEIVNVILIYGALLPGLAVLVPLWFPNGLAPTPNWRWVGWLSVIGAAGVLGGVAFVGWVESGPPTDIESCASVGTCATLGGLISLLLAALAAIVSFVVRWHRSRGMERLQLRWLVPAFLILLVGVWDEFFFEGGQDSAAGDIFLPLGLALVPVVIGIAVLRYRLYEIDRIISRTVGYALVVGLLGVVLVLGTVWLPSLLMSGQEVPSWLVAASTLAVAALFNPVRRRVLHWVDRRFYRARYDAEVVAEGFSARLRDEIEVDQLARDWVGVVNETMQPASIGVWVTPHRTSAAGGA